jgi:hypothetical protein
MNTNLVRLFGFLALITVGACSSVTELSAPKPEVPKFTCFSNSATMRLSADLRATLPAFGPRVPDDAYVSISQSVPGGFAGVFFEDNHYVLTFVDPAKANQARSEIQQAFVSRGVGGSGMDVATAEIRGARWTFAELDEWYRYIIPKLFGPGSGISSSDIDEKANTISFGVIDETARAQLEARLASLSVSCNLVTTVIQPYAIAL